MLQIRIGIEDNSVIIFLVSYGSIGVRAIKVLLFFFGCVRCPYFFLSYFVCVARCGIKLYRFLIIYFGGEIWKIILKLFLLPLLIRGTGTDTVELQWLEH